VTYITYMVTYVRGQHKKLTHPLLAAAEASVSRVCLMEELARARISAP